MSLPLRDVTCACGHSAVWRPRRTLEMYVCRKCKHRAVLHLLVRIFGPAVLRRTGRRAMAEALGVGDATARNWLNGQTIMRVDNVYAAMRLVWDGGMRGAEARVNRWRSSQRMLERKHQAVRWNECRPGPLPSFVTREQIAECVSKFMGEA